MNNCDEKLAHAIKLRFGTSPKEPTESQLSKIKSDIQRIVNAGRKPTESDWLAAVMNHCPDRGQYKYAGLDNSDLNTLLQLATNPSNK